MDVNKLQADSSEEEMMEFVADYEKYKFPYNISYSAQIKGFVKTKEYSRNFKNVVRCLTIYKYSDLAFKNYLKLVKISFSTSTFDRIVKVSRSFEYLDCFIL